jgi:hypothetical protein
MRSNAMRAWTFAILCLGLLACADRTTVDPTDPTVGAEALPGPPKPFDQMTQDEQKAYMMNTVLPVMRARFQAFDAEYYADFGCPTCHGPEPKERGFAMPEPALPSLPAPDSAEWNEMMGRGKSVVRFMAEDVVPAMAALLGKPAYDPAIGEGFGCFGCHTSL